MTGPRYAYRTTKDGRIRVDGVTVDRVRVKVRCGACHGLFEDVIGGRAACPHCHRTEREL